MIYFIKRDDGLVKIGVTGDFFSRFANLKREHGEVKLLGWHEGDRKTEDHLHHLFRAQRVIGEWFTFSDELMDYIQNKCRFDKPARRSGETVALLYVQERIAELEKKAELLLKENAELRTSATIEKALRQQTDERINDLGKEVRELYTKIGRLQAKSR